MCGIAGGTRTTSELLERTVAFLEHRGPDGNGVWRDDQTGVGFAHTRLAVIDLSPGGAQPMVSDCGRYVISFNGEIYNYRELRAELEAVGERFRTASDTEVLLCLLRRFGIAGIERLIGMFAFAFWDKLEKSLFLVRDRLGIKPLLYAPLQDGGIAFASEMAALKSFPGLDLGIDREALSEYLACLYVPAPRTIFAGIRKLPPGHWLRWRNGETAIRRYWKPQFSGDRRCSVDEAAEEVLPLLRRAVAMQMTADVPVGCFLSGGIDSSVVAALMADEARRQGAPPIRTFTMTFEEAAYDERIEAARIASHVGSCHTELPVGAGLAGLLDRYVDGFGEPFGNPTALLIHELSRRAREHVTVALVGDGGDEVFAGYPRYRGGIMAAYLRRLPGWFRRKGIEPLARFIPESSRGHHGPRRAREFLESAGLDAADAYASWVEYFTPEERRRLLGLDRLPDRPIARLYRDTGVDEPLNAMQQTDLLSFLPGNLLAYGDAMSMAHALELRLPLIDHVVIQAVGGIDADVRFAHGPKTILKAVARRLLPSDVIDRPKRGFNPPMGIWLKNDLSPMIDERLGSGANDLSLDSSAVAALVSEQRRGFRDVSLKVWGLLAFDGWRRRA